MSTNLIVDDRTVRVMVKAYCPGAVPHLVLSHGWWCLLPATLLGEVLVGKLVECRELRRRYETLRPSADNERIEERLADHEAVIDSLRERFAELNRSYLEADATNRAKSKCPIDVRRIRAELADMDDRALLRYGTILKYICVVEAKLLDLPLDESEAIFQEVREEWCRRFRDSAIAESL
ncbi:MAG: hypothetical protein ABSG16_13660 [Candidatus Acidiferrum sp.]